MQRCSRNRKGGALMKCNQLAHVNFDDKPQYEGLSSMWGSKVDLLQIDLNGTIIEVRNNL
jgi:hypothetical protein